MAAREPLLEVALHLLTELAMTNAREMARWVDQHSTDVASGATDLAEVPYLKIQATVLQDLDHLGRCNGLGAALYTWTRAGRPPGDPEPGTFYGLDPDHPTTVDQLDPLDAFIFRFTVASWNRDYALAHTLWHAVRDATWATRAVIRLLDDAARRLNARSTT